MNRIIPKKERLEFKKAEKNRTIPLEKTVRIQKIGKEPYHSPENVQLNLGFREFSCSFLYVYLLSLKNSSRCVGQKIMVSLKAEKRSRRSYER